MSGAPPHTVVPRAGPEDPAERLREALELFELGERLFHQRMRREHPEAGEDELERLVIAWLCAP
jgi:hypothetical protein